MKSTVRVLTQFCDGKREFIFKANLDQLIHTQDDLIQEVIQGMIDKYTLENNKVAHKYISHEFVFLEPFYMTQSFEASMAKAISLRENLTERQNHKPTR